jgi:ankyrin repeat protein
LNLAQFASQNDKYLPLLKYLLDKGMDINIPFGKSANTPLHIAADGIETVEIIGLLMSKKANINAIDNLGNTPLHCAARK